MADKNHRDVLAYKRRRVRKRVSGTPDRPRLCVFKSRKHISAQLVDDIAGRVLLGVSTQTGDLRDEVGGKKNKNAARVVGQRLAELAKSKNITAVAFDRSGYIYHGKVASLADGAREGGLQF